MGEVDKMLVWTDLHPARMMMVKWRGEDKVMNAMTGNMLTHKSWR